MKKYIRKISLFISTVAGVAALAVATGVANAQSTSMTAAQEQRLQAIISKGNQEIDRRLVTLNALTNKINAAAKLTASDKTTLSNEVSNEINGLTALKSKLDSETTLASARSDAQSIYAEYRVYALVAPKVALVKVADDQQVVESKLNTLAGKLQTRITDAKNAGKDTTALQSQLDDMESKTAAAQSTSSSIEQKVISLQPTDYNSDHSILSGDKTQLQNAHTDNQAAYTDAKAIVQALKSL